MTGNRSTRRPSPKRLLQIGLLSLLVGLLAMGASLPLTMLADMGWPWNASLRTEVGVGSSAQLIHDDGRVETFAGTDEEVDAWMARREDELKNEYGLDRKIAAGNVLARTGLVLVVAGVGSLLWWLTTRIRDRSVTR